MTRPDGDSDTDPVPDREGTAIDGRLPADILRRLAAEHAAADHDGGSLVNEEEG